MLNAIQMGILTSSTKERLEALEEQQSLQKGYVRKMIDSILKMDAGIDFGHNTQFFEKIIGEKVILKYMKFCIIIMTDG